MSTVRKRIVLVFIKVNLYILMAETSTVCVWDHLHEPTQAITDIR